MTIVGARPEFIQSTPVSRALRQASHQELLVHTGQHYDNEMSHVFFEELSLHEPYKNLGCGSGSQGVQTGRILARVEAVMLEERPDWVLVYGDTNSTLAGALAAAKLHIPVAHVEAGMRSFNRRMPEEINRVLTDHISSALFCPTDTAVKNLRDEGITEHVYKVGDVTYEASLYCSPIAEDKSTIFEDMNLEKKHYYLATVHRPRNTDDDERLQSILNAFGRLEYPVVFLAHPRVRKVIEAGVCVVPENVRMALPVGYLDMLLLERHAKMILTDSGGIQKEAYFHAVPCVTLREETEWVETVEAGWNRLVGADEELIVSAVTEWHPPETRPPIFGDGRTATKIISILEEIV